MRVTIEVPENVLQAAEARERHIVEFVEELIVRGLEVLAPRPSMNDAIERIRALHNSAAIATERHAG